MSSLTTLSRASRPSRAVTTASPASVNSFSIVRRASGRSSAIRTLEGSKEGEAVHRRQVLAKIDSARIEAGTRQSEEGLQAARAELDRADADLENARLAFERTKSMHDQKLVSDQALDQAQAQMKMSTANV